MKILIGTCEIKENSQVPREIYPYFVHISHFLKKVKIDSKMQKNTPQKSMIYIQNYLKRNSKLDYYEEKSLLQNQTLS